MQILFKKWNKDFGKPFPAILNYKAVRAVEIEFGSSGKHSVIARMIGPDDSDVVIFEGEEEECLKVIARVAGCRNSDETLLDLLQFNQTDMDVIV